MAEDLLQGEQIAAIQKKALRKRMSEGMWRTAHPRDPGQLSIAPNEPVDLIESMTAFLLFLVVPYLLILIVLISTAKKS